MAPSNPTFRATPPPSYSSHDANLANQQADAAWQREDERLDRQRLEAALKEMIAQEQHEELSNWSKLRKQELDDRQRAQAAAVADQTHTASRSQQVNNNPESLQQPKKRTFPLRDQTVPQIPTPHPQLPRPPARKTKLHPKKKTVSAKSKKTTKPKPKPKSKPPDAMRLEVNRTTGEAHVTTGIGKRVEVKKSTVKGALAYCALT